jgi:hypothetical protein
VKGDLRQAALIHWNPGKQHLVIEKWVDSTPQLTLKILPLSHP